MMEEEKELAQKIVKQNTRWIWINITMGIFNILYVLLVPQPIIFKVLLPILSISFFCLAHRNFKLKQQTIKIINDIDELERTQSE